MSTVIIVHYHYACIDTLTDNTLHHYYVSELLMPHRLYSIAATIHLLTPRSVSKISIFVGKNSLSLLHSCLVKYCSMGLKMDHNMDSKLICQIILTHYSVHVKCCSTNELYILYGRLLFWAKCYLMLHSVPLMSFIFYEPI